LALAQINLQRLPLAQRVINGDARQTLRQISSTALEPDQTRLMRSTMGLLSWARTGTRNLGPACCSRSRASTW
jgi:hypothetical protein